MDYEPNTPEEDEFLDCLCDDIHVCAAENVGRCKTCYSIVKAIKERAVLMPLAANFKPIMPGQTVWNIFTGNRYRVEHIECFEDATVVAVRHKDYGLLIAAANSLTHKCPDKAGDANEA